MSCNRGKRSVALDLKDAKQLLLARELIGKADIVVENFSPGVMDRLGLGYEAASEINPSLIYCSISGYGKGGSAQARPGYDAVFQAESGLMSLTGAADGPPTRAGVPVVDYTTGVIAVNGILGALFARSRLGKGQYIEVAMFDVAINMLGNFGMNYLISGEVPQRHGNHAPLASPVGTVKAADGAIYLSCANQRLWLRLAELLRRPDLRDNPDYADNQARISNRMRLFAELDAAFGTKSVDDWMVALIGAGIPAGHVRNVAEAFEAAEASGRALVREIDHPTIGAVPTVASPLKLSVTPVAEPVAPPSLGADSAEVLREMLGCSDRDMAAILGL